MISPLDKQRVNHINHLMDNINDQSSQIYESLIDKDFLQADRDINKLITTLQDIKSTLKDDI
jgi:hypothetical protein